MDIDFSTATAIGIINRSILMHPSLFRDAVMSRYQEDIGYASKSEGRTRQAVLASADASLRGYNIVAEGYQIDAIDMASGIILLNIACKLQCIPAYVRTAAALRTWPGDDV